MAFNNVILEGKIAIIGTWNSLGWNIRWSVIMIKFSGYHNRVIKLMYLELGRSGGSCYKYNDNDNQS